MITPSFGLTATERVLPKLALDFTTASLDPRVTFTRALNTATCVDSSGNIITVNADLPRFDYDSITLACKGLLIEESRTNSIYDSAFSNIATSVVTNQWYDNSVNLDTTSNASTSPANTTTAALLAINTNTTNTGVVYRTGSTTAGTYTYSVFTKMASTDNKCHLILAGDTSLANSVRCVFTMSGAGSVGTVSVTGTATAGSGTITRYKNDWYRCTITCTLAAPANINCTLYPGDRAAQTAASQIYAWGAQIETGAFATSYIPTTSAALTRNADVVTMTGTNFSDWYNQSEGSFNVTSIAGGTLNATAVSVNNASNAERIAIGYGSGSGGNMNVIVVDGNVTQAQIIVAGAALNTVNTACGSYKLNDIDFALNGTLGTQDTSATIPTPTQLSIGATAIGSYLNGWVKKLNYWNINITQSEVQAFSK